jgi:malonate-semialdehyde dehydrogenase (acetylating)/methylmalonate-semialdehyde dehydrogenase
MHRIVSSKVSAASLARRYMSSQPRLIPNFINGKFEESKATKWFDVHNPATQEVVCRTPQSTPDELKRAEQGAAEAFKTWRETPVQTRQRVMFNFQKLVKDNTERLAESITIEQGKTLADARGDVFRGLEVVENACGFAPLIMGETLEGLARGLDTYSYRQPLGVSAGICPFNFPAMIPLWMFPLAAVCGNTFVSPKLMALPVT